jgi:protein subunit release factor A
METIYLEIREAEGGDDAKLLVSDMASLYQKVCSRNSFDCKTFK